MRITNVIIRPVLIPVTVPLVNSFQSAPRQGYSRLIVTIETDSGLSGYGETWCGVAVRALLQEFGSAVVGHNPFAIEALLRRFRMAGYWSGYAGFAAVSALEIACWDLIGKAIQVPLADLIGGRVRQKVNFAGYLFFTPGSDPVAGVTEIADVLVSNHGFRTLKLKAGALDTKVDEKALRSLRARFPDLALRVDPNGKWQLTEAVAFLRRIQDVGLEYVEDPCWGLESLARVRQMSNVPIATNMFVVNTEQVPLALKLEAVDVVLADPNKWGGVTATKNLAAVCEAMQWGLAYHSGGMLGVSMAVALHIGASTPSLTYALDTHYPLLVDDVITGGRIQFEGGSAEVPTGPGLGVDLDGDKMDYYEKQFVSSPLYYDAT